MSPTFANGKICYIMIPATDIPKSVAFYEKVFGWNIRKRDDGSMAFDDGVGEVSGTWVTGRAPANDPGVLIYIMVESAEMTLELIRKHGGEIVKPLGAEAPETTAWFRDPAGNVFGVYEERD